MSSEVLPEDWTAKSVLDHIAKKGNGGYYHCLIDVGAIITGMTNLQVAHHLISTKDHLPDVEGVVFLDELDNKMMVRFIDRTLDGLV